jgi:tRNA U34 5-carboxymethylaminomethyl modifying enzyme MnmG/GidA
MKRYNTFYQIHKALRALLFETAIMVQHTDFTNEDQASATAKRIAEAVAIFDSHAHTEDNFILPVIELYEPAVATLFEAEHVQDMELSNRLSSLLNELSSNTSVEAKEATGNHINVAFNEFIAFNLTHMAKEEKDLNQLLWKHLTDEQLHGITMEIIAKLPFEKLHAANTWMMRGLSNNEISNWLTEIKNTAPGEVFNGMMQLAETELPELRFNSVTAALAEGAMLA